MWCAVHRLIAAHLPNFLYLSNFPIEILFLPSTDARFASREHGFRTVFELIFSHLFMLSLVGTNR